MPGFPIRTSSDQRFIDNSPRLNAALHVLHRLSMPRHPPCALNNEHTTNTGTTTTQKQQPPHAGVNYTKHKRTEITQTTHPPPHKKVTAASMQFNARVHYTVLTQHPTPTNNHESLIMTAASHGLQPGDNAPDTQQCTKYFKKDHVLVNQPSG